MTALASLTGCARGGVTLGAGEGPPDAGDYQIEIDFDRRDRYYLLHVPPRALSGEALPLVLALHGGGGNPAQFKEEAGFDELSDREGFFVVYPAGTGVLPRRLLTWNAGTDCCGYALENEVDDVAFLEALIDDVARRARVDENRVYVTGHSNGGMMSHRFAAEASDRVAAIAPVAGAMGIASFNPARPVPVLHIHSVDDPRALYYGGLGPPFPLGGNRVEHEPVMAGIEKWIERNGCGEAPRVNDERVGEAGTMNAGQRAVRLTWEPCAGAPVVHWRLEGVGHGWPGAVPVGRGTTELLGIPTTLISAAEEAWRFFRDFSIR
jgi:polyhydroxybutyrate depolymerase